MKILIIGCGYVGYRAALQWIDEGNSVAALTRSTERAKGWATAGIQFILGDVLDTISLEQLPAADLCLYAVGYDRSGSAEKRSVYVNGVRNVLEQIKDRVPRLIYVSSSSVYGQSTGEWVNEESPCEPTSEGGVICLDAEEAVREIYQNRATMLRLSGIYGPGRLMARTEQLMQQVPLTGNPDAWLNLVHVNDIVTAIHRLANSLAHAPLYLLSDEQPITRREFYSEMAQLINAPAPLFTASDDSTLNKRCDSSKIRTDLHLKLQFPTIHTGLPSALTPDA